MFYSLEDSFSRQTSLLRLDSLFRLINYNRIMGSSGQAFASFFPSKIKKQNHSELRSIQDMSQLWMLHFDKLKFNLFITCRALCKVNYKNREGRSYLQPHKYFKCIINSPLSSSEGSNHNYTKWKATSAKPPQPQLIHSLQNPTILSEEVKPTEYSPECGFYI